MQKSNNPSRLAKPSSYTIWVGVFWLLILLVAGGFYYATQKIAYTWRWNRVPIYFAYKDTIDIITDIDGDVESITKSGKEAVISVKGDDSVESYTVPAESKTVDKGYYVYAGETLASYTQWKPGLMVVGLWITLKVSLYSIVFGILIGLIMAYVMKDGAADWLQTHYRFQIRTYWIGLLYVLLGVYTLTVTLGYFILLFTFVWVIVRCTKGLKQLSILQNLWERLRTNHPSFRCQKVCPQADHRPLLHSERPLDSQGSSPARG